jgi:hypothetical protein
MRVNQKASNRLEYKTMLDGKNANSLPTTNSFLNETTEYTASFHLTAVHKSLSIINTDWKHCILLLLLLALPP